jgi:hypothetical protein
VYYLFSILTHGHSLSLLKSQGRVHNPSGDGVRPVSSEVRKKTIKYNNTAQLQDDHETKVKDVGSARRNITRKNSTGDNHFDSKNKKQGGAG